MTARSFTTISSDRPRLCLCALLVVILVAARPAPAAEAELPPHLQQVFAEGVSAQKAGQLDVAERKFRQILAEGGARSYVHNNLGIVYQQRGEHPAAIAQFRAAVELNPGFAPPRILWGASLLALGRAEEGARQLERAAQLAPREPLVREQLARAYDLTENLPGLLEQYRMLRELVPEEPEYVYQLGNAYLRYAAWCYTKILKLDPQSARRFQALAETLRFQGRSEQAIRAYELAAQANPQLRGIHLALSHLYLEQGRRDEAWRAIEEELRIAPESALARDFKRRLESRDSPP